MSEDSGFATWIALGAAALAMYSCDQAQKVKPILPSGLALDTQVQQTNANVGDLTERLVKLEIAQRPYQTFSPTEKGFGLIATEIGAIAIIIDDVKAYGNGSRVSLRVGNPHNAALTDLKFKTSWGSLDAKGERQSDAHHTGELKVPRLIPGAWVKMTENFPDVPPERLGYIDFSEPEVDRMSMVVANPS